MDVAEYEERYGYIKARLLLLTPEDGALVDGVHDNHRADFELKPTFILGAALSVESADSIPAGQAGMVRIHPTSRGAWFRNRPSDGRAQMLDSDRRPVASVEILEFVDGATRWGPGTVMFTITGRPRRPGDA